MENRYESNCFHKPAFAILLYTVSISAYVVSSHVKEDNNVKIISKSLYEMLNKHIDW